VNALGRHYLNVHALKQSFEIHEQLIYKKGDIGKSTNIFGYLNIAFPVIGSTIKK
jgi:hypothetical protein